MEKESPESVEDRSLQEANVVESMDKVDTDGSNSELPMKPESSAVNKDCDNSKTTTDSASTSRPTKKVQDGVKCNLFNGDLNSRISCTACYRQIFVQKPQSVYRHPVLHVLLCKKCYEYYMSGEIRLGEDGVDEQCRWCGDGGKLILCDNCSNTFCKHCIKHNLGRSAVAAVTGQDNWNCYVCDPTPLEDLVTSCSAIMEAVEAFHNKPGDKGSIKGSEHLSSSSSESDPDFEELFGTSKMKDVLDYLKSFTQPLYQTVLRSEKQLAKNAKSGPECDKLKRDLTRKFCKLRKALCKKSSQSAKTEQQNGSVRSAKSEAVGRTRSSSSKMPSKNSEQDINGPLSAEPDSSSESAADVESSRVTAKPTRNDMEAQRKLHRHLLGDDEDDSENDDDDEDGVASNSDDDDSSSADGELSDKSSSSSDDEYNPAKEKEDLKAEKKSERSEQAMKAKTKAAMRKVKEIRAKIEKNKLKHKKKEQKTKAKKSSKSDSEDEKDEFIDSVDEAKSSNKNKKVQQPEETAESTVIGTIESVMEESADEDGEEVLAASSTPVVNSEDLTSKGDGDVEECGTTEEQPLPVDKVGMKTRAKVASSEVPSIDKVIANLEKMPKITIKLSRLSVNGKSDKLQAHDKSKSESKLSKESANKTNEGKMKVSRQALIEGLTSDEDNSENDEVCDDEEEDKKSESQMDITDLVDMEGSDVENGDEEARKALLAKAEDDDEDEPSDEDNDDASDDDDIAVKAGKKKVNNKTAKKSTKALINIVSDSSEGSEKVQKKKKTSKSSKLLRAKLSDSDDETGKKSHQKRRSSKTNDDSDSDEPVKKSRKRKTPASDEEEILESSDDDDDDDDNDDEKKSKRRRIQIHSDSSVANNSVEEIEDDGGSSDDDDTTAKGRRRKKIRKILKEKALSKKTVDAAKAEQERRERIAERQKLFNQVTVEDASSPTKSLITTKLVLEADESDKEIVEVNKDLICKLKPHQVEAVKFMWNCCVESLERLKKEPGSGCILAHCMGLGKTLSVISFVHTVLSNAKVTKLTTCLVLCPLNTILNWQAEFEQWLEDVGPLDVYEMSSVKDNWGRSELLNDWKTRGGVMIMGYEMFRNLSQCARVKNKKQKKIFTESLLDPGPDLVVCDEGHVLKNDATGLSKATTQVKTRRRIVLTGTPLQNNLVEYHCMVNFVKPNLLGSRKEFCNRFVNPIMNGQCSDSSARDVKVMKHRAHILHDLLAGCVQRKDYSALTKFLPPKHEYVVSIRLSKTQVVLYEKYLDRLQAACGGDLTGQAVRGSRIFTDYQNLMKIWTHPWVLKIDEVRQELKRMHTSDSEDDSFIDDSGSDSKESDKSDDKDDGDEVLVLDSDEDWKPKQRQTRGSVIKKKQEDVSKAKASKDKKADSRQNSDKEEIVKDWKTRSRGGEITGDAGEDKSVEEPPDRVSNEWWAEYFKLEDQYNLELSGKLQLLAEILKMAESIGDKVLVFSQSLLSLDLIEQFLAHWDSLLTENSEKQIAGAQTWVRGYDYFRMDGSSSAINRRELSITFNDPENIRARLFLISTRAGSLGINLVAANRVIVFDASWNPTHDVQSIFRVYRFGQKKPVYVYRFLAQGTMEEKIYERQVTKQSLAQRVIDEHQIERHFSANDLRDLYVFKPDRLDDPNRPERPTPTLPKDRMLAELLVTYKNWIVQYHEHDSLLENKLGEELTEEERKAAWEEYENEKKGLLLRQQAPPKDYLYGQSMVPGMQMMHPSMMQADYSTTITSAHQIAKAIFASNPGISQAELTSKVTDYLRQVEIAKQQEANAYRRMVENSRLLQMQEERRRQEMLVHNYRSRLAGTPTDQALDQDLISILADRPNHSRVASASSFSGVEKVSALKDRDRTIVIDAALPVAGPSTLDPSSMMYAERQPSSSETNNGKK